MGGSQSSSDSSTAEYDPDYNPAEDPVEISDLKNREYPFENLVLAGGGAKACAYAAAFEVLDEVGILKNIKRIAGTSGGAIAGALLAVGYSPDEIKQRFQPDWENFADSRFGWLSMLPNLYRKFGWNPGRRALEMAEQNIADKTGKGKLTFRELYDFNGKELCVVVTNLSSMSVEYFHPKTTPNFAICEAARMSMSIPGYMEPFTLRKGSDIGEKVFVDGGLVCNYPIHVFDGWGLSMKPEDSYFRKLFTGNEWDPYNPKTLGINVYEGEQLDTIKPRVHYDLLFSKPKRPDTKLARAQGPRLNKILAQVDHRSDLRKATRILMEAFRDLPETRDGELKVKDVEALFQTRDQHLQTALTTTFGKDFDVKTAIKALDANKNGKVTFDEFMQYLERTHGFGYASFASAVATQRINSMGDFFWAILNTWMVIGSEKYLKKGSDGDDECRTIAINTDYIGTMDMGMEDYDLAFLYRQGKTGTAKFLTNFLKREANSEIQQTHKCC